MRTKAQICLRAAESVDKGVDIYSCLAITRQRCYRPLARPQLYDISDGYAQLFKPRECTDERLGWGVAWGRTPVRKKCRVLALCFAAAMAETGDL